MFFSSRSASPGFMVPAGSICNVVCSQAPVSWGSSSNRVIITPEASGKQSPGNVNIMPVNTRSARGWPCDAMSPLTASRTSGGLVYGSPSGLVNSETRGLSKAKPNKSRK